MADEQSAMYKRAAEILKAIGNPAPGPGRNRFPGLPPEQADDVQRKLTETCQAHYPRKRLVGEGFAA
jgi:hypothetical protein